eukprot:gene11902-3520_t
MLYPGGDQAEILYYGTTVRPDTDARQGDIPIAVHGSTQISDRFFHVVNPDTFHYKSHQLPQETAIR